jgi:uncharacterized protein
MGKGQPARGRNAKGDRVVTGDVGPADRQRISQLIQLVVSCAVLGVGVGVLLRTALGSDGYSTFVNGASIALHLPFVAVNCALGVVLVAVAWARGVRPGIGTVVQPVLVGMVVSATMALTPIPHGLGVRLTLLVAAFAVVAAGVAGYLGSATGAGPTEAAALAFDPPLPFRWSYSVVQGVGAVTGWLLGAAVGPGTIAVIVLLGPAVDVVGRLLPAASFEPVRCVEPS